ncbi:hypothetical protein Hamer_G029667 [Homarus americanus]|uniref:Uncharacterized protein n=1 Tax=Homarus americanus TaxID=6706 RepID=A0A8J5MN22_HOMAM|nr:hypothetical protein Hamer_G029667 [Homarus americanus]
MVWAQTDALSATVVCSSLTTTRYRVHRLPPFDLDDCSAFKKCKKKCALEYDTYTNGGDLNCLDNGYTVGQEICIQMAQKHNVGDLWDETVCSYARQCNGPWDYDGESSINNLCCSRGHFVKCSDPYSLHLPPQRSLHSDSTYCTPLNM